MRGKRNRKDVIQFSLHLMDNVLALHHELVNKTYRHGGYQPFRICDPKPRDIHKAIVRDRLVHHAIYRVLYPYFDRQFIHDSYSCRDQKGTHRAINRFCAFGRKVSRNNTQTTWVLKCDIRKFFANIDHSILLHILKKHIGDADTIWLLKEVIGSFQTAGRPGVGLPLGNLTSQILVNIYMNEFDQFVKRNLKVRHYIRYADDFVALHEDRSYLMELIAKITIFLTKELRLSLHPQKVSIATLASGTDFLGWVHFPFHRVLRMSTKRRMMRRVQGEDVSEATIASYRGLLSHGNTHKLVREFLSE